MIDNFIVKSHEDTYYFLREVVPLESQNSAIVETQDRLALAIQGRTTGGRDGVSDFRGRGCSGGGRSRGRVGEMIYCYYCKEVGHTKYNCQLLQGKQQLFRFAHLATIQKEQSNSRSCVSEEHMKDQLYWMF